MGFISHRFCLHPKIWTKYVKTDLFQVYNEGEQLSFSSLFQRTDEAQQRDPMRGNTPDPLTHSSHAHWHRACKPPERGHWQNNIRPLLNLHVPTRHRCGFVKAVRERQIDLYLKCTESHSVVTK